jgi:hypothetical protein
MCSVRNEAAQYFCDTSSDSLSKLKTQLRLSSRLSRQEWLTCFDRILGAYSAKELDLVFLPNSAFKGMNSGVRAFRGGKWKDVIVVPHYDLPGRICGFMAIGREAKPDDVVFRRVVTSVKRLSLHSREGGLGCYTVLENVRGNFGDKIVAVGDTFLALRLHTRHFAVNPNPLPLVSFVDCPNGITDSAWRSIPHKTPVIWDWKLTPSVVYQAIVSNGHIAITQLKNLDQDAIDHYVRSSDPIDIIRRVLRLGKPWREFLETWSEEASDKEIENIVLSLKSYKIDTLTLSSVRGRFRHFVNRNITGRTIKVGPTTYSEMNGYLWRVDVNARKQTDVLLLNAIFRISGAEVFNEGGREVLRFNCKLVHEGTTINFQMSDAELKNNLYTRLQIELAKVKPGGSLFMLESSKRDVVNAAKLFAIREAEVDYPLSDES